MEHHLHKRLLKVDCVGHEDGALNRGKGLGMGYGFGKVRGVLGSSDGQAPAPPPPFWRPASACVGMRGVQVLGDGLGLWCWPPGAIVQ